MSIALLCKAWRHLLAYQETALQEIVVAGVEGGVEETQNVKEFQELQHCNGHPPPVHLPIP